MQWGDQEEQQPRYICAGCGERYVEKNPPCQKCASEQFARLEDGDRIPDRVKDVANVQWRCTSCGEIYPRNNPPCNSCGTMQYRAVSDGPPVSAGGGDRKSTTKDTQYYVGVVLTSICVILFPYFLFLVAIPESILSIWGKSIQDQLGSNGRGNPFMSGSFLIIRWFGNFLVFLMVLGFLGGLVLGVLQAV